MNYSGYYPCDNLNGEGYRVTLFVSGCGRKPKCQFCHNQKAWDFNYGDKYTEEFHEEILRDCSFDYIDGLSILGGEPMDNLSSGELLKLVRDFRELYPNKTIYCWTGYIYENLIKDDFKLEFIKELDYLIDGDFQIDKKDLNLGYAGSSNQRWIDVKRSLKESKVVLYKEKKGE